MSLRVAELEEDWFDARRYTPRIPTANGTEWFLLTERFRPVTRVPTSAPDEPWAGREELSRAFEETYRDWALSPAEAADRSLEAIRSPGGAVIVTGQQPGFLGGPLLVLFKALTAVAAARKYEATTGRPCAPVFWVAGDDHDLDEIRSAHFPVGASEEATLTYPTPMDRRPVADYPMDERSLLVLEELRERFAKRRFGDLALEIAGLYRGRRLAGAFAAVINRLLGHTGLLVIDPVRLRPLARPLWKRVIDAPGAVLESIARGREEVEAAGIEPFVSGRLPLFLLIDGQRHHLEPHRGDFRVSGGGPTIKRAELLSIVEKDPSALSAGALLRPLFQQFTLPGVLTVGGPAEVGYFAQLPPLATELGLPVPAIALRVGATLVDGQAARLSGRYEPVELARADSAEQLLLARETPDGIEAIRELAGGVGAALVDAISELPDAAPGRRRLESRAASIANDIRSLGDRLAKTWAQTREAELGRIGKLRNQVFPSGVLQERRWNALHFVSRHGTRWIDELLEAIAGDPLKICHRFVTFEPSSKD